LSHAVKLVTISAVKNTMSRREHNFFMKTS
jgi:hypothetical protein